MVDRVTTIARSRGAYEGGICLWKDKEDSSVGYPDAITMTQKFQRQEAYCVRKPPTMGAKTGPLKLAAVNSARERIAGTEAKDL